MDPDQENQGYNLRAPQGNLKTKHVSDPRGGREKVMIFKTLIFDRKLILGVFFPLSPKNSEHFKKNIHICFAGGGALP